MAAVTRRKNQSMLEWLRAAFVALATYAGLLGLHFGPSWGAAALALGAGVLTLAAVDLGVLVALVALALPMTAVAPVAGITFLVLGVIGIRYLGTDGGQVFFVIAAALAGAFFGPVWACVALAGYIMGGGEGALAAAIACLSVEALGIALGKPAIGVTYTGGAKALLDLAQMPANLFSAAWVKEAFGGLGTDSVNGTIAVFTAVNNVPVLILQPALWAAAAGLTGMLADAARRRRNRLLALAAVAGGALVPALGAALLLPPLGASAAWSKLAFAAVSSAAAAVVFAWVWDRVFPREVPAAEVAARPATMAAEDADVDELLRLISTAEEKLTNEHTTNKTVMITDMKSFSRMTEEDGSMLTAKAIQKHRDLLMPIISQYGGSGKSTGGDGLIAAFDAPASALRAAAAMQVALAEHNRAHPDEREMFVRIGVADGEVVLDKSGRPFIGAALNLAARVMNLADGGQSFTTAALVDKAGSAVRVHSHGTFELKNIAAPVEIFEILATNEQEPKDPRERLAS